MVRKRRQSARKTGPTGLKPLDNWLSRHQNPVSFWMHMVGIPATVVGVILAIRGLWIEGAGLFAAGYAMQFLGHAIEGNRSGEEMLVRRLLGRGENEEASSK